jgi:anti-anti-sigma regulatory factor
MLRIEKESDGCVTRLLLSGRIQSDRIACIRSAMNDGCARQILDLREVTLVDSAIVQFLIDCENEGIELVQLPPYVREWMFRERAEGVQAEPANGG